MKRIETVDGNVTVVAMDPAGPGGGHHVYTIGRSNTDYTEGDNLPCYIHFQNGGVAENGVNGVTNEALLQIVIDRLQCFQDGPFPCDENAKALICCENALAFLKERTRERQGRGVEGKETA